MGKGAVGDLRLIAWRGSRGGGGSLGGGFVAGGSRPRLPGRISLQRRHDKRVLDFQTKVGPLVQQGRVNMG